MKKEERMKMRIGCLCLILFVIWTVLIQVVDVRPVGIGGTNIGFSRFNTWFHSITDVNMTLYTITDWLGLVPIVICMIFGAIGLGQLIKRKELFQVDWDILVLGIHYIVVIAGYLIFEMIPINYRPVLIDGVMEASYPSSTTLLVLGVMPTLIEQVDRRIKNNVVRKCIIILAVLFSVFMVGGRLISGVHWFSDIAGSILLGASLFGLYSSAAMIAIRKQKQRQGERRSWNFVKNFRN